MRYKRGQLVRCNYNGKEFEARVSNPLYNEEGMLVIPVKHNSVKHGRYRDTGDHYARYDEILRIVKEPDVLPEELFSI